jgi:hypothetical protein
LLRFFDDGDDPSGGRSWGASDDDDGIGSGGYTAAAVVALVTLLAAGGFIVWGSRNCRTQPNHPQNVVYDFANPLADRTSASGGVEYAPPSVVPPGVAQPADGAPDADTDTERWVALTDEANGDTYYYNLATKESTWRPPPANCTIVTEAEAIHSSA